MEKYLDFYDDCRIVEDNEFRKDSREGRSDRSKPPSFAEARALLPEPHWAGHAKHIECYWRAWQLAFINLERPHRGNGFVSPYLDTAFNQCCFLWDSVFALHFGRYGRRAFNFQRTLDNLYAKQHSDGFISREIREWSGQDQFHRHDPASTGPNVLAWSEWEYYCQFGDRDRLGRIFPVLLAYHRWLRLNRTWPDGSYQSCGLACGMDNQPRPPPGYSAWLHHGFQAWIDATCQAVISARLLLCMAAELGHASAAAAGAAGGDGAAAAAGGAGAASVSSPVPTAAGRSFSAVPGGKYEEEVAACIAEVDALTEYVRSHMWDARASMFVDRRLRLDPAKGVTSHLSPVKSVGAYWALLAGIPPREALPAFIDHLDNPSEFNRPVRVPSLPANDPHYNPRGGYWCGASWAPTTYMVLRGLSHVAEAQAFADADDVAADIGCNYVEVHAKVFANTGTVWENLAPELHSLPAAAASAGGGGGRPPVKGPIPGDPAKPDFVGWSALGPIAVLFEYVFGLRPHVPSRTLVWDIRLLDAFGVKRYPFGVDGLLDLEVASRGSFDEPPRIRIRIRTSTTSITSITGTSASGASASGAAAAAAAGAGHAPLKLVVRWGKRSVADGGFRAERTGKLMEHILTISIPPASPSHAAGSAAGAGATTAAAAGGAGVASAPAGTASLSSADSAAAVELEFVCSEGSGAAVEDAAAATAEGAAPASFSHAATGAP